MTDFGEQLLAEMEDMRKGARYRTDYRTEPLVESVRRRVRLVWGCLTLRPDRDFHDEWSPFRQQQFTRVKVWPGDEGYDESKDNFTGYVYLQTLASSPWVTFTKDNQQP